MIKGLYVTEYKGFKKHYKSTKQWMTHMRTKIIGYTDTKHIQSDAYTKVLKFCLTVFTRT